MNGLTAAPAPRRKIFPYMVNPGKTPSSPAKKERNHKTDTMKRTAYSVYTYPEIVTRLINATLPLEGPSGYPVTVRYDAGNETEPPTVYVQVEELQSDGWTREVFSATITQNTTLEGFYCIMSDLEAAVMKCCPQKTNGTLQKANGTSCAQPDVFEDDNLPF